MTVGFSTFDYVIFAAYALLIISVGLWVSRSKDGKEKSYPLFLMMAKKKNRQE